MWAKTHKLYGQNSLAKKPLLLDADLDEFQWQNNLNTYAPSY
jgi:hypothetical protein